MFITLSNSEHYHSIPCPSLSPTQITALMCSKQAVKQTERGKETKEERGRSWEGKEINTTGFVRRRDGQLCKIGADVNLPTYGDEVMDARRREVGLTSA
jgi:hypothetical protein